ncbi:hypothetical protein KY289_008404 [Solanum tuberosum]|nr:hypothetical protein KY289_008404 [Solanum tuberosum]
MHLKLNEQIEGGTISRMPQSIERCEEPNLGREGQELTRTTTISTSTNKVHYLECERGQYCQVQESMCTMVQTHKLAMLVLLETKITNHKQLTNTLKFDTHIQSAANGLFGGIIIMWKERIVKIDNLTIPSKGIHVMVKVLPNLNSWLFSAIYASPNINMRMNLYDELC